MIFWVTLLFICIALLATGWHIKKVAQNQLQTLQEKNLRAVADLTVSGLAASLKLGVEQLKILSKYPALKYFEKRPLLSPAVKEFEEFISQALEAYQFDIGNAYNQFLIIKGTFQYWSELPQAAMRRIWYFFSFSGVPEDIGIYDEGFDFAESRLTSAQIGEIYAKTAFARSLVLDLKEFWANMVFPVNLTVTSVEELFNIGKMVVANKGEIERYFSVAHGNKSVLRGLDLINVFGSSQLDTNKEGISELVNNAEICNSLANGRSFWSGPVVFNSDKSRCFWQIAVPVRDRGRNLCGCLKGAVLVDFFQEWFKDSLFDSGTEILLLDRDFSILLSSSKSRKRNSISFLQDCLKSAKGNIFSQDSVYYVADKNKSFLVKPVATFKGENLPPWLITVIKDQSLSGICSDFLVGFALIVLAAAGMYVLSYSSAQLLNLTDEEVADDR